MKTPYKILLWDMDGTLMDSQEGLISSLQYTLQQCGLPLEPDEKLRSFLGPSLKYTFQNYYGLSDAKADEAISVFRGCFSKNGMFEGNHVYEGIFDLLKDLQNAGYRMAIATSKLEKFAVEIAGHFGLSPYFDYICGSDAEGMRPEKTEVITWALSHFREYRPQEILMIGDRRMDVEGAAANGIDSAAVLYGYGSMDELSGARFIVPQVEDFRTLLLPSHF